MKKGYWISLYFKIDNQENLKRYAETVTPIIKSFGGKPLVRGGKYISFNVSPFGFLSSYFLLAVITSLKASVIRSTVLFVGIRVFKITLIYYMADVIAPLVINVMFISWISPRVAPYSALVIMPAKPIFLAA